MELNKKTTFRKIQFLCLMVLLALAALSANISNCKRIKSNSQAKKKWFGALLDKVKTALPDGMLKNGVSFLADNIREGTKEEESHLFRGIAQGIGFSLSADFEKCLKQKFMAIQEKLNPIIFEYQKFINDLNNVSAHIVDFTKVADLSVDAYNRIAECNQPVQPQNASLFNRLVSAGTQFVGNAIKKHVNGSVDMALAGEMAKHLTLIKDFKGTNSAADEEAKGKLLGGLIKAVVDKRGRRRKLLKRRRL